MSFFKILNDNPGLLSLMSILSAIVIGIFTAWTSIIRKKLTCQLISLNEIVNLRDSNIDKNLKVVYGTKEVENPVLIEIAIENLGNKPIVEENFRSNLVIEFPDKLEVLETECIFEESKQYEIKPVIGENRKIITFPKFLLNSGKCVTLKIVGNLRGQINEEDINFDAYIEGVKLKKLKSLDYNKKSDIKIQYVLNLIPIIILILFLITLTIYAKYKVGENILAILFLVILFAGPICCMMSISSIRNRMKNR